MSAPVPAHVWHDWLDRAQHFHESDDFHGVLYEGGYFAEYYHRRLGGRCRMKCLGETPELVSVLNIRSGNFGLSQR